MNITGLVDQHAYIITNIVEIFDKNKQKVRLVKLFNPWGPGGVSALLNDYFHIKI